MTYIAVWTNRHLVPGGVAATLVATDNAGNFPDVRQDFKWRGKVLADLTNPFLIGVAKKFGAYIIEQEIAKAASLRLVPVWDALYASEVAPATAQALADLQAQWAANQTVPSQIVTFIQNVWATYGVDGQLPVPIVTIDGTNVSVTNG